MRVESFEMQEFLVKFDKHRHGNESSRRRASIRLVGLENFEREVLKEKMPVLVLCMHQDSDFYGQIEIIERITSESYCHRLKVCLLKEESVGVFREKYGVGGTPTFIVFRGGREISRLLGQAESAILQEFLSQTLSSNQGGE